MGTANFYSRNASRVFAFTTEDEWEWNDMKENIASEIEAISKKMNLSYRDGGEDNHSLRSFPSESICSLGDCKDYKGFSVEVIVSCIIRSGYYSGGNLDWDIQFYLNGNEAGDTLPEVTDLKEDIEYYRGCTPGKAAQLSTYACNWMEKTQERLVSSIEEVYKQFTEPLQVAASFSNGETIYKKETETQQEAFDRYINAVV